MNSMLAVDFYLILKIMLLCEVSEITRLRCVLVVCFRLEIVIQLWRIGVGLLVLLRNESKRVNGANVGTKPTLLMFVE